ncbi:MAG TPA: GNAT family N-acetyltransferase [Thermoflexia bacterium]|nr:GNAT family N-acetyltransferase [Thermoflexia bacterium]
MKLPIRTLQPSEFEEFMRFLERAYGHSRGFFQRAYPHLYQPTPEKCSTYYVIKKEGKILSHIGLYPLRIVTAGVELPVGGIGGVATLPAARGHGHMTRLSRHVIGEMRAQAYPLSWLDGDRQRYNAFGWELAASFYQLTFSRRSLSWGQATPTPIEEVLPGEAVEHISRFMPHPQRRPELEDQLRKADLRVWVSAAGYVIAQGQDRQRIKLVELVSASGNEIGLISAVLAWNFGEQLTWELSTWDTAQLARLMPYAADWKARAQGMYRINELTQLLQPAEHFLQERAAGVRDFALTLGIREHDRLTATTIALQAGVLQIRAGRHAAQYMELSPITAARLILGGPPIPELSSIPGGLRALLPLPVYVPPLDYV